MSSAQLPESSPTTWNRKRIESILPHRGVMALPDCVSVAADGRTAVGFMRVPVNEITEGHFGVCPGVMQVELAYQVLGVLEAARHTDLAGVARTIQMAQFNVLAKFGDVLRVDVKVTKEELSRKGGTVQAIATLRNLRDGENDRNESTAVLEATAVPKKIFERMIRTQHNAGTDENTIAALASLPPEIQAAIPPAPAPST